MANMEDEKKRAEIRGDKRVLDFSGAVRSVDAVYFEEGDQFTFPNEYEVYEQKVGNSTAQYILVTLTNGNVKPFYPSIFSKKRRIYNQDGTATDKYACTTGDAAEEFRKTVSMKDAMDKMKGKTIKFKSVNNVTTLAYGETYTVQTQIPEIVFVQ